MSESSPSAFTSFQCSFKPVDIDSPSDSFDEPTFSAAIFREMDIDNDESSCSNLPPTVSRANPITDRSSGAEDDWERESRVISPYPYSPTSREIEELQHLTTLGCDWKPSFREYVTPDSPEKRDEVVDFSFYFEAIPSRDQTLDSDDVSFISHDGESLADEGFCLDAIDEDPTSFWERSVDAATDEQRISPAQISLGSETFGKSPRVLFE